MIERIEEMPAGTIGLRASGKLSKADYTEVLEPALKEAVATGEARVLFEMPDFDGLEAGAWIEDAKTGLSVETKNRSAWKRIALVTDIEWMVRAMHVFAWLTPGELRTFGLGEAEEARRWVAAD
jgi:hypothetical protein